MEDTSNLGAKFKSLVSLILQSFLAWATQAPQHHTHHDSSNQISHQKHRLPKIQWHLVGPTAIKHRFFKPSICGGRIVSNYSWPSAFSPRGSPWTIQPWGHWLPRLTAFDRGGRGHLCRMPQWDRKQPPLLPFQLRFAFASELCAVATAVEVLRPDQNRNWQAGSLSSMEGENCDSTSLSITLERAGRMVAGL